MSIFKPEFKIQATTEGFIQGIQGNYVEGVTIPGITIEDVDFIEAAYVNLEHVQRTKYYNYVLDIVEDRPHINAEPNKLTIAADGIDLFILTGLPIPCTVTVDSAEYQVNDGEFGFPTVLKGTYTVKVSQFPYIDKEWEVVAV